MIYIAKLALELILVLHVLGCFWFRLIDSERDWAPPIDFIYVQRNEYLRFYDLEEVDDYYQYWVSVYYAIAALGGNEMGSRSTYQLLFWFFALIGLVLLNGYVFGQMTIRVSEAQKQSSDFQKQIDEANTAMNDMKLKNKTQEEVRFYLLTTMGTQYEQKQLTDFQHEISETL